MYGWTMAFVVKVKIAPHDANEVIEMVGWLRYKPKAFEANFAKTLLHIVALYVSLTRAGI